MNVHPHVAETDSFQNQLHNVKMERNPLLLRLFIHFTPLLGPTTTNIHHALSAAFDFYNVGNEEVPGLSVSAGPAAQGAEDPGMEGGYRR